MVYTRTLFFSDIEMVDFEGLEFLIIVGIVSMPVVSTLMMLMNLRLEKYDSIATSCLK